MIHPEASLKVSQRSSTHGDLSLVCVKECVSVSISFCLKEYKNILTEESPVNK